MSMPISGGIASTVGARPADVRPVGVAARVHAGISESLWPADRGVAELRWAAVTLAIMVLLGIVATVLDPVARDFVRLLVVAIPASIIATVAGWGPFAGRIGASHRARLAIGPLVLAVAVVGAGITDVTTLTMPPAAPLVFLAMAFAALTPGYPIAAVFMIGASASVMVAHWQVTQGVGLERELSDEFVVGAVVILIASAGMAGILSVATKAETRASEARRRTARAPGRARDAQSDHGPVRRLAARADRRPGRHRRHRPGVRDHARLDLPADQRRAPVDGRRGRLSPPVPRDRRRRRHHRPGRRDATDAVRRRRPQRPRLPRRPGRRPNRGGRRRSSTATSCSPSSTSRAPRNGRSAPPRSRWPRWSPSRSRRPSARPGSTMSGATGCTRSNGCWG